MRWEAIGAIEMVQDALVFVLMIVAHKVGKRDGVQEYLNEKAERRSLRRAEGHAFMSAATGRHRLDPFPGDDENFEKLATTGELRAYAETGDIGSLQRETAAFFRILSLRDWTRKRETV